MVIERGPTEKIGMTIKGGAGGTPGNPNDSADEGVFVSKVCTMLNLISFLLGHLKSTITDIYIHRIWKCVCMCMHEYACVCMCMHVYA